MRSSLKIRVLFILGTLIQDNNLVAHEMFHFLKIKSTGIGSNGNQVAISPSHSLRVPEGMIM